MGRSRHVNTTFIKAAHSLEIDTKRPGRAGSFHEEPKKDLGLVMVAYIEPVSASCGENYDFSPAICPAQDMSLTDRASAFVVGNVHFLHDKTFGQPRHIFRYDLVDHALHLAIHLPGKLRVKVALNLNFI